MRIMILIILAVVFLSLSFRVVKPNRAHIVIRLGKPVRIKRQGFHFIVPFIESVTGQSLFDRNLTVSVDGLTRDNVRTTVGINVVYRVKDSDKDILASKFGIDNPVRLVQATVDEQLRAKIFTFEHEDIFAKRQEIGDEIKEALIEKLGQYGMELDSVQVTDISLEPKVMEAMNQIVAEEKMKKALITSAEARKEESILNAQGDKEVKKLIGAGMALQRMEIAKGFKESVEEMQAIDDSLSAKDILDFLIVSSRLETLEKVGDKNAKVIYLNENLEGRSTSLTGTGVETMTS